MTEVQFQLSKASKFVSPVSQFACISVRLVISGTNPLWPNPNRLLMLFRITQGSESYVQLHAISCKMFCKMSRRQLCRLDGVSEEGGVVARVLLQLLLGAGVLMGSLVGVVAAGVLAAEVDGHADGEDAAHGGSANEGSVAGLVVRSIVLAVDKARDGTTEVTLLIRVSETVASVVQMRINLRSRRAWQYRHLA